MSQENRKFIVFNVSELTKVNFDDVVETSAETIRVSVNGLKTFVKWEGETPSFISTLTTKEGPYTFYEMQTILISNEWVNQNLP